MKRASNRLPACCKFASLALVLASVLLGCSTRPDIVGHNSEAQDWAEEQRRNDAQRGNKLDQGRGPSGDESADRPPAENAPRPTPQPPPASPQPAPQPVPLD